MAGNVVIRPVGNDERAAWEPLWNGYLAFYEATPAPGARRQRRRLAEVSRS
jgi:hypothetical protein